MRLVCQYYVIRNIFNIVNPIHGCGVEITPNINPIYDGLERSCPGDSNYVDVGLV